MRDQALHNNQMLAMGRKSVTGAAALFDAKIWNLPALQEDIENLQRIPARIFGNIMEQLCDKANFICRFDRWCQEFWNKIWFCLLNIVKPAKGFAHVQQTHPPACAQQIVEQKVGYQIEVTDLHEHKAPWCWQTRHKKRTQKQPSCHPNVSTGDPLAVSRMKANLERRFCRVSICIKSGAISRQSVQFLFSRLNCYLK